MESWKAFGIGLDETGNLKKNIKNLEYTDT